MITDQQIQQLRGILNSGADTAFFFSKIKQPDWLPALARNGFYSKPPPPIPKGNTTFHPVWPQSRYLRGLIEAGPAEVAAVATAIPATENANVNEDIFRIAVALPPEHMGGLVPRVEKWLKTAELRWHSHALAEFVSKAAQSGEVSTALRVAANLLSFRDSPSIKDGAAEATSPILDWKPEPVSRFESYEYGELLTRILPTLTKADARGTLKILCRVLNGYVELRGRVDVERPGYDGSQFWRPSISDHDENSPYNAVTSLVTALARLGEQEIASDALTFAAVRKITGKFQWDIFRRLELHWMRKFADRLDPAISKAALLNRDFVRSDRFDLEYGELAKIAFPSLDEVGQNQVIAWIDVGPKLEPGDWQGAQAASEEIKQQANDWADRWRQKKLFWIKDHLPGPLKSKYAAWEKKFGVPEHPGFHAWVGSFESGLQSPLSVEDFAAKSIKEQANHFRTWEPKANDFNAPTREGLAALLQTTIAKTPSIYIQQAEEFLGLQPVYIGALFAGLWESLKTGAPHDMTSVWKVAEWLLTQPNEETDLYDELTRSTHKGRPWRSARLALARLLNSLLGSDANPLPAGDQGKVWPLLEQLATDPDPGVHARAEQPDNEDSMGPLNLSLNTVRGEAIHGVFSYITWQHHQRANKKAGIPPEAEVLLERHLDPAIEETRTIRSIYGANINRLVYWDAPWVEANRDRIFSAAHSRLDEIAWSTFITHAQPFIDVFQLLQGRFERAVEEMASPTREKGDHDPRVSLGSYLVALYWGGSIDFKSADSLLTRFFAKAPDAVRGEVIKSIGISAKRAPTPIAPVVMERLVKLWEWRVQIAQAQGGKNQAEELANFVWWFHSEKFDEHWAAVEMVHALELAGTSVQESLFLRRFAELADKHTAEALRALELAVVKTSKLGSAFWFDNEAITILSAALQSMDANLLQQAKTLQDAFVKQGRYDYIKLPKPTA